MSFSKFIGIDVSKLTLDVEVLPDAKRFQADNDDKGIKQLIRQLEKKCLIKRADTLFAFEHTGFYSHRLAVHLQQRGYAFTMLSGLELKRSQGLVRGKSDPFDARKIAEYVDLRKHKIIPTQLPGKEIIQLKQMLSLRAQFVRYRAGLITTMKEAQRAISRKDNPVYFQTIQPMIEDITRQIKILDRELMNLINSCPKLKKQFDLCISIKGIGPQTALYMIVETEAFTKFPTARKFACYAGIAPFPNQSGTSIRGRTKTSHLANKKMKALFSTAASSAIQYNTDMKLYYQKRIKEGHDKRSTQNIIRNKLVARVFAVISRGTPYVEIMKYAA